MKRLSSLFLIAALAVTGWSQSGNTEFRATWVITWEHVHSSWSADQNKALVREILDNHKAANMNAVLWQARQSGTAYYNSSYEPWGYYAGYSDPGYDPLTYVIEEAHKRGIEVHAWFNAFHASSLHAGAPAAEHPDWVCRDQSGIPMNESRALSPGMTAVRDYTLDVTMEIVNNYDIDGIHLDYIRWNEYSNSLRSGLSQVAQESQLDGMISDDQIRALESDRTGRYLYDVDHPYSAGIPAGYDNWEDWWRSSVTTFVEMLHDSIQVVKPHVRLSVAALGKYNWSGWQGYGTVYQDAAKWYNDGSIEQLTPMNYHWLDATSFYNMLEGGCPECWSQWIQPGIAAGRLFSAGPGSYRLSDENVWGRHPSIVNRARTVPWVDGFQFFSYGSWDDNNYWETAGSTFFSKITKVRETDHLLSTSPVQPAISLVKIDSMNYELTVTPSDTVADYWFALYRSENDSFNVDSTQIIDIHYSRSAFTAADIITGLQDYNGEYSYAATQLNRYWKESGFSSAVIGDSIPSFAPIIVANTPMDGDTIDIHSSIEIQFSKTMDITTVNAAVSLNPDTAYSLIWSSDYKQLTVDFDRNLPYASDFTFKIDSSAADVNGRLLDANGDGVSGDSFILNFSTDLEDVIGPVLFFSNLDFTNQNYNIDIEEVITIAFNEIIEDSTLDTSTVRLTLAGNPVECKFRRNIVKDRSVFSLRPEDLMLPHVDYQITLDASIADTSGNLMGAEQATQLSTENALYSEITMISNLSSVSDWAAPDYSGSTTGIITANTYFTTSSSFRVPATIPRRSARLHYEWDTTESTHMIREYLAGGLPRAVEFDTTYILQCFVYGDGNNNKFRFALDEKIGLSWPNHEVSQWITIDWYGWRLIQWDLSDPGTVGSWIGNEILDGSKYRIDSFQFTFDPVNGDVEGDFYMDELRIIKKRTHLGIEQDQLVLPDTYVLHQNYPNPFNPNTTIAFTTPTAGGVSIEIFDILGRHVITLTDAYYQPGYHVLIWNGRNGYRQPVSSGTYIYRLESGNNVLTKRMIYLK